MATTLQFLKFSFLRLVITFFVSVALIIVMVPGDCCFYVYCVNVHFHREKIIQRQKKNGKISRLIQTQGLKTFVSKKILD